MSSYNWLDLRFQDKKEATPSWCHGAAGIALSYLSVKKLTDLQLDFINWEKVASVIVEKGLNTSHILCHGLLGNAEATIAISNIINKNDLKRFIQNYVYREMLFYNKTSNWKTGFTNGKFSLTGLMLGTAGIGYGLLKTFWEDQIPSVLTLEPPLQLSFEKNINNKIHEKITH